MQLSFPIFFQPASSNYFAPRQGGGYFCFECDAELGDGLAVFFCEPVLRRRQGFLHPNCIVKGGLQDAMVLPVCVTDVPPFGSFLASLKVEIGRSNKPWYELLDFSSDELKRQCPRFVMQELECSLHPIEREFIGLVDNAKLDALDTPINYKGQVFALLDSLRDAMPVIEALPVKALLEDKTEG